MTSSAWLLIIKAVLTLLPLIVSAVRDGRIKEASEKEIVDAILTLYAKRIEDAVRAGDRAYHDDSLQPNDPNDRSRHTL